MPLFRIKPGAGVVTAYQYSADAHRERGEIPPGADRWWTVDEDGARHESFPIFRTPSGDVRVADGDWFIRGDAGEFYLCNPGLFAAIYEQVDA